MPNVNILVVLQGINIISTHIQINMLLSHQQLVGALIATVPVINPEEHLVNISTTEEGIGQRHIRSHLRPQQDPQRHLEEKEERQVVNTWATVEIATAVEEGVAVVISDRTHTQQDREILQITQCTRSVLQRPQQPRPRRILQQPVP